MNWREKGILPFLNKLMHLASWVISLRVGLGGINAICPEEIGEREPYALRLDIGNKDMEARILWGHGCFPGLSFGVITMPAAIWSATVQAISQVCW